MKKRGRNSRKRRVKEKGREGKSGGGKIEGSASVLT